MLPRVLVVGQVPPPYHGQAVMVEALLGGTFRHVRLVHLPADYSESLDQVGSADLRKVIRMIGVIVRAVVARITTGASAIYYHPAGANRSAVLRDVAVLNVLRPLFGVTILHWHARGLPGAVGSLPPLVRAAARHALGGADVSIAPSEALLDEARQFAPKRAVVVPNGTRDGGPMPDRQPTDRPDIVFLNLLSQAKGAPWLVEALGELQRGGVSFHATLAGTFPSPEDEASLRRRIDELDLGETVEIPGLVIGDAKWELLRSADVFCVPTRYAQESFGLAMVEAASCGAAVVTTDTPGVREVFEPGISAMLVDPDRPDELASVLGELCADPVRRAELGRAARRCYEERYTLDRFRQGIDEVFTNLFGCSSSSPRSRCSD